MLGREETPSDYSPNIVSQLQGRASKHPPSTED